MPGAEVARIDPATGTVTQTISLDLARAGALGFGANRLWISDLTDDALIEVEPQSGKRIRAIPLELHPTALAASGESVWAADYAAGTIAEVDARSGQTVSMVNVGNGPVAIAVRPDAVWVVNSLDATVSRVDRQTHAVLATIPVGSGPSAVAATAGSIWVANEYSGSVSRIDPATNAVVDTNVVGGAPTSLTMLDGEVWVGFRSIVKHRGGTLVLQHTRPISIDPALHMDMLPPVSDDLTRDGLVTYNHVSGPAGTYLVPNLAVSIPAPTHGGRTYTFRLRPLHSLLGRTARAGSRLPTGARAGVRARIAPTDLFTGIVGADACAPHSGRCDLSRGVTTNEQARTVTFRLRDPDASFLTNLTVGGLATPVPPGTPLRPAGDEPIPGTGPYMIASVNPAEIRYVRNPVFREWSRAAKPDGNPHEIVMRFDERPEALAAAVEDGRADWTTEAVPASRLSELARTFPDQLHSHANPVVEFFQLNTRVAPFDDVRVRRALNFAFDRGAVVSRLGGEIAATPTLPGAATGCARLPAVLPVHTEPAGRRALDGARRRTSAALGRRVGDKGDARRRLGRHGRSDAGTTGDEAHGLDAATAWVSHATLPRPVVLQADSGRLRSREDPARPRRVERPLPVRLLRCLGVVRWVQQPRALRSAAGRSDGQGPIAGSDGPPHRSARVGGNRPGGRGPSAVGSHREHTHDRLRVAARPQLPVPSVLGLPGEPGVAAVILLSHADPQYSCRLGEQCSPSDTFYAIAGSASRAAVASPWK